MAVRSPRLDDRAFADLVTETLARIPAHTPEYTNPVVGDPGRTLIELFSWLTDTLLYRVNLIPERQRLEFLRRVGVPLRGATPARGLVALQFGNLENAVPPPDVETLRPWCAVKGPSGVEFETRRVVSVLPIIASVYHKRRLSSSEVDGIAPLLPDLAELYQLGGAKPRPYVTTETFPGGHASALAVDFIEQAVDGCVWLAVFAGSASTVAATRSLLGRDNSGQTRTLSIGVVPVPLASDAAGDLEDLTLGAGTARPIPVSWEISTGRSTARGPVYHELEVMRDGTQGLTRTGVVELALPDALHIGSPDNDVRTLIDAGVGSRPPRLDDDELNDRLVTWLRLRPHAGVGRLALSWIAVNAVDVDQRRTVSDVVVGTSTGAPDQRFQLPLGAIERSNFQLQVEETDRGWVDWQLLEHLALASPEQRAFALDDEEGFVDFGDGMRGRIPERDRRVRIRFMRAGGGTAGNLPPGSMDSIAARRVDGGQPLAPIVVTQAVSTIGGTAAESLEEAERRIPDVLRHRHRAVTLDDVVAVAALTPGERLGRIEVIPGFKPHQRRTEVPGVFSVAILPRVAGWLPPNPRPSRHTIEAVYDWLSPRVPLASELYVIALEYRPIGVSVGFELRAGFEREPTVAAIRETLRQLLWPLSPGGPFEDQSGWPRGRAVRARELQVAVARVPGVDEVLGVNLFVRGNGVDDWEPVALGSDGTAQIGMSEWQLPELLGLAISVDEAPSGTLPNAPSAAVGEVAVPVVPEVC